MPKSKTPECPMCGAELIRVTAHGDPYWKCPKDGPLELKDDGSEVEPDDDEEESDEELD